MAIIITLDVILAMRKMKLNDLAERVGLTAQNLSILKTGRARGLRFTTLDAICRVLDCQPGDLLKYKPDLQDGAPEENPAVDKNTES